VPARTAGFGGANVNELQAGLFVLLALGGLAVVLLRDPLRQALMVGVYGLLLALLFFVLQAPDVALSQIVVCTVAVPVMILLALAKVRTHEHGGRDEREPRMGARRGGGR
jgi:energy-converting hydrogenase B subunit D